MDQTLQNVTKTQTPIEVDVTPIPFTELSPAQQHWVDYNVLQGMITNSDGSMDKMTVGEFASTVGVARKTCYEWTKNIPNFWQLVNQRRKEMFMDGARLAKVYNALFLAATSPKILSVRAMQTYLANADPNFRMPAQKVEHEVGGGLADLLERARQRQREHSQVIEGETVNDTNSQ